MNKNTIQIISIRLKLYMMQYTNEIIKLRVGTLVNSSYVWHENLINPI